MKILSILTFSMIALFGFHSFAITRVIECEKTANISQKLTIVLRGGIANFFTCQNVPCSKLSNLEPAEIAELNMPNPQDPILHYNIIQGSSPAQSTVDISFGPNVDSPVVVSIDGDSSQYSCF